VEAITVAGEIRGSGRGTVSEVEAKLNKRLAGHSSSDIHRGGVASEGAFPVC
jgi:hypothetical protein